MGRHRLSGPDPVKVSVLLSPELHRQIEDVGARRKWDKSRIFRHLLELGLDAEQRGEESSPSVASSVSLPGSGHEGPSLAIDLTAELLACVEFAAKLHGLQPAAVVLQLIGEHIEAWITKGRARKEELRRLIEGERQEH